MTTQNETTSPGVTTKPSSIKYVSTFFANTNEEIAKLVEEVMYTDPVKMIFITPCILDTEKKCGKWKIEVHSGDSV